MAEIPLRIVTIFTLEELASPHLIAHLGEKQLQHFVSVCMMVRTPLVRALAKIELQLLKENVSLPTAVEIPTFLRLQDSISTIMASVTVSWSNPSKYCAMSLQPNDINIRMYVCMYVCMYTKHACIAALQQFY